MQPFCKHFGRCGGCKFQDVEPSDYASGKRGAVEAALRRRGIEAPVAALVDAHGAGRRRATFHIRDGKAGYMMARSHNLVDIDLCPILVPALQRAADIARDCAAVTRVADFSVTAADNGIDANLKAERRHAADATHFSEIAARHGLIRFSFNGDNIFQTGTPAVNGVPLPSGSFLQATALGEETLTALVARHLTKSKSVADLFCGVGPFAMRLARASKVYAYDNDTAAITSLVAGAKTAPGLKPVQAERRNLFREPLTAKELTAFDGLVFDPPRAGAEAQAKHIAKSKIANVAAVACDAETFARDAKTLIDGGYSLTRVIPIDQFKWSPHIEIFASFER